MFTGVVWSFAGTVKTKLDVIGVVLGGEVHEVVATSQGQLVELKVAIGNKVKKGDVIATRDFSANDGSAYTIFYDQKKNKVSEGKVIGKNYEGEWKYYHKSSKVLMTVENYKKQETAKIQIKTGDYC